MKVHFYKLALIFFVLKYSYVNAQPDVPFRNKVNQSSTNNLPYFGVVVNIPIFNVLRKVKLKEIFKKKKYVLEPTVNDDPSLPFSVYRIQNCETFTCYYEYQYEPEDDPAILGVAWAHNRTQSTVCESVVHINGHTYTLNDYIVDFGSCGGILYPGNPDPDPGPGGGGTPPPSPPSPPDPGPIRVPNMPRTIENQVGPNLCVPTIMAEILKYLCQIDNDNVNRINNYYHQTTGKWAVFQGVDLQNVKPLIEHFLRALPVSDIISSIQAGKPVMIGIPTSDPSIGHNVLVTGYDAASQQFIYLDPLTGGEVWASVASINSSKFYSYQIDCK